MPRSHMQALVAGARRTTATTRVVDCADSVPHSNSDRVFVQSSALVMDVVTLIAAGPGLTSATIMSYLDTPVMHGMA